MGDFLVAVAGGVFDQVRLGRVVWIGLRRFAPGAAVSVSGAGAICAVHLFLETENVAVGGRNDSCQCHVSSQWNNVLFLNATNVPQYRQELCQFPCEELKVVVQQPHEGYV